MMRILFIDSNHPILHTELEKAGFICDHDDHSSKEEIEKKISAYGGIIIRSRFKIDKTFLEKADHLKFIARVGAGMENIDIAFAENKGIKCLHAPEGNRDAVGEHALGMLLSLFNHLCKANTEVREGKWIREANRGIELSGKTVGIIGYGNMGSAFAERLKGFGVKILAFDKYRKNFENDFVLESTLERLFDETDVVSIHLPLTEETHYMVNDTFINRFKKKIYIINTARGKILKTDDLVKNIKNEKVLGACLDVLEYESVSFENIDKTTLPEAFLFLINSDKVILSPHIAGWTFESQEKMARILVEKIKHFFS